MTKLFHGIRSAFTAAWIQSTSYSDDLFAPKREFRKWKFVFAVLCYPTSLLMTLPAAMHGDLHLGGTSDKKSPTWMILLSKKGDKLKRVMLLCCLVAVPLLPFFALATVILASGSVPLILALTAALSIYVKALIGIGGLVLLGVLLLVLPPERRRRKDKDGNRSKLRFEKHDCMKSPLEAEDYEVTALAALPGAESPMLEVLQVINRLPAGTRVAVSARAPYLVDIYKRWFDEQYRKNKMWGVVPVGVTATKPVSSDDSDTALPVSTSLSQAEPDSIESGNGEPEIVVEFRAKKGRSMGR